MLVSLRSIRILVWKNLMIKRRFPLSSFLEFLFPVLLSGLLFFAGTKLTNVVTPTNYMPQTPTELVTKNGMYNLGGSYLLISPADVGQDFVTQLSAYAGQPILATNALYFADAVAMDTYLSDVENINSSTIGIAITSNSTYTLRLGPEVLGGFDFGVPPVGPNSNDPFSTLAQSPLRVQALIDVYLTSRQLGTTFANVYNDYKQVGPIVGEQPQMQHNSDSGSSAMGGFIPFLFLLFLMPVANSVLGSVTAEREERQRELLKILGASDAEVHLSWLISFTLIYFPGLALIVVGLHFATIFYYAQLVAILIFILIGLISTISFAMLLSTIFSKARLAQAFGTLIFISSGLISSIYLDNIDPWRAYALALLPPTYIVIGMNAIMTLEYLEVGLNLATLSLAPTGVSAMWIMIIGAGSAIGCLMMYVYVDKVMPHDYGTSLPWNFPFKMSYWFPPKPVITSSGPASDDGTKAIGAVQMTSKLVTNPGGAQTSAAHLGQYAFEVRNLTKIYDQSALGTSGFKALDGVSFGANYNEVVALLGPNGAGKSTLINILTGMSRMTGGSVHVAGYDAALSIGEVRKVVSLCPQHDIIWSHLTVIEHGGMVGVLRGMKWSDAIKQSRELFKRVDLAFKEKSLAKTLSGGMKRKLNIVNAFLGAEVKIVILDEPTSGLDPASRRLVWDLLKSQKENHCVLICTHYMDEAEAVGDRIAILNKAKLVVYGDQDGIKRALGFGCHLTLSDVNANVTEQQVLNTIQACIGAPQIKSGQGQGQGQRSSPDRSETLIKNAGSVSIGAYSHSASRGAGNRELIVNIPQDCMKHLLKIVAALEDTKICKKISMASMKLEEVFTRAVAEDVDQMNSSGVSAPGSPVNSKAPNSPTLTHIGTAKKSRGPLLFLRQAWVVFNERRIGYFRDPLTSLLQMCLPLFFMLTAAMPLILLPLGKTFGTYLYTYPTTSSELITVTQAASLNGTASSLVTTFLDLGVSKSIINDYTLMSDTAATTCTLPEVSSSDVSDANLRLWVKSVGCLQAGYPNFAVPSTKSVPPFMALQYDNDVDNQNNVYVAARIFTNFNNDKIGILRALSLHDNIVLRQSATNLGLASSLPTSGPHITMSFNPFNLSKDASLKFSIWQFILLALFFSMSLASFSTYMAQGVIRERESGFKQLLYVSGTSSPAYWLGNLCFDALQFGVLIGIGAVLLYLSSAPIFTYYRTYVLGIMFLYGIAVVPMVYLLSALMPTPATAVSVLSMFSNLLTIMAPLPLFGLQFVVPQLADVRKALCVIPHFAMGDAMITLTFASVLQLFADLGHVQSSYVVDLSYNFYLMGGSAVFMFFMTCLIEYTPLWARLRLWSYITNVVPPPQPVNAGPLGQADDRAIAERQLVESAASPSPAPGQKLDARLAAVPLLASGVTKQYWGAKVASVYKMSVHIDPGQLLCLLGVNGAGKTSFIRICSTELIPTDGRSYVFGKDSSMDTVTVRCDVGNCPQFDAHIPQMTVMEHLLMFARVRGFTGRLAVEEAERFIRILGMTRYTNTESRKLSGGYRRRVSLGIALMGGSKLLFLDEPSCGMDPLARKELWNILRTFASTANRGILLTTHAMEEAENVSDRIAIMAKGELRTIGTVSDLIQDFTKGFEIAMTLREPSNADMDRISARVGINSVQETKLTKAQAASAAASLGPEAKQDFERMFAPLLEAPNSTIGSRQLLHWLAAEEIVRQGQLAVTSIAFNGKKDIKFGERYGRSMRVMVPAEGYTLRDLLDRMERITVWSLGSKSSEVTSDKPCVGYACSNFNLEQIFNSFADAQESSK